MTRPTLLNPDGTITAGLEPGEWLAYAACRVWGSRWRPRLAAEFDADPVTVWRQVNGGTPIQRVTLRRMAELMDETEARRE